MRRATVAGLTVCLLLTTAAQAAVAQGEDEVTGADLAHYERFEIPHAGVAMSFPLGLGGRHQVGGFRVRAAQ